MGEKVYMGIDLGHAFHQVALVKGVEGELAELFRIGRGRVGVGAVVSRVESTGARLEDVVITVEATSSYWNELVWGLTDRGYCVYLADPKKAHDLRKFYALHTKTDVTDAEALARIPLVDGDLRPVSVPSASEQALLRLCRLRWKYRCRVADLKRRVSKLGEMVMPGIEGVIPLRYSKSARLFLRRYLVAEKARRLGKKRLGQVLLKAAWGKFSDKKLERLWQCIENAPALGLAGEDLLLEVGVQLDELEVLERQIQRLDERIAELYTEVDPEHRLIEIPGLGEFLAAAMTAVLWDIKRFANAKCLISYSGLAPRVKHSAGRYKTGQSITKHGNPYLRAWAYLAAANSRQYDPELKAYYQRLRKRGKHFNVAMCATAARLLERVYEKLSERQADGVESQDRVLCPEHSPTRVSVPVAAI